MAINKINVSLIGKKLPQNTGRTDEGTPISLFDFKGRAIAVFFTGEGILSSDLVLVRKLKEASKEFLLYNCSPVWVSTESEEILAAARDLDKLPFMIISDFSKEIHNEMQYDFSLDKLSDKIEVWIADDKGKIISAIPSMEPGSLVNATMAALPRYFS